MYYVYLLKSIKYPEIYVGSTNNLRTRFALHNTGKVFSTKRYMPWELIYYEAFNTEKLARMREKKLKYNGNSMRELKKRIGLVKSVESGAGFMASHSTSTSAKGFTLIEILVSLGIFAIISTFGLFVSMDFYRSYSFRSELNIVVSSLQKARGRALANINQSSHGVHYDTGSNCVLYDACYIIFQGTSFTPGASTNLEIEASSVVNINWPSDVVFNQIDAVTTPITITLTQDSFNSTITSNNEGRIDWQ